MIKESNRFLYQNNLQEKFFIFINKFIFCFENSSMGCTKPATVVVGFFIHKVMVYPFISLRLSSLSLCTNYVPKTIKKLIIFEKTNLTMRYFILAFLLLGVSSYAQVVWLLMFFLHLAMEAMARQPWGQCKTHFIKIRTIQVALQLP